MGEATIDDVTRSWQYVRVCWTCPWTREKGEREIRGGQKGRVWTAQARSMGVATLPRPLVSAALTIHESCFRHSPRNTRLDLFSLLCFHLSDTHTYTSIRIYVHTYVTVVMKVAQLVYVIPRFEIISLHLKMFSYERISRLFNNNF